MARAVFYAKVATWSLLAFAVAMTPWVFIAAHMAPFLSFAP